MKRIIATLATVAALAAGGLWVRDNAVVRECHKVKIIGVKVAETCSERKMFS